MRWCINLVIGSEGDYCLEFRKHFKGICPKNCAFFIPGEPLNYIGIITPINDCPALIRGYFGFECLLKSNIRDCDPKVV